MILRELYELYGRLMAEGAQLPSMGRSLLPVSFRIVLTPHGELVRIEDARSVEVTRKTTKKGGESVTEKLVPTSSLLLGTPKPSGAGLNPCFLWDNAIYLLGYVAEKQEEKSARISDSFDSLRRKHLEMEEVISSPTYSAVCRFLENWKPEDIAAHVDDVNILSHNGVFRIQGEYLDVHQNADICRWWDNGGNRQWWGGADKPENMGRCLITNENTPIARLHEPAIKGVLGAQSSGAKLVSFNCDSFESYGCEQSANAPVSEAAAFAYCNALNYLLSNKENRVRMGESTVLFWTDAPSQEARAMEELARWSFDPQAEDDGLPDEDAEVLLAQLREGLQALSQGKIPAHSLDKSMNSRFFILGLSPNAARLSVRFYRESTFGEFLQHLGSHLAGMALEKRGAAYHDPDVISPFMILRESVRDVNKELPPVVIGGLMNAIIAGVPYPEMLAMSILRRFKADGNINYIRCAFLKAWLTRNHNINLKPMLDTTNTQPGYLLGRLFAALVKTQEDALGKSLNRNMREAYYGSASAAPRNVFPRLMRLYNHHLGKLEGGHKVNRERAVQDIMASLSDFPAHLTLAEQGAFAIGYYHQMQSFYAPTREKAEDADNPQA